MNTTTIDDNTYNIAAFVPAADITIGDLVYADGKMHTVTDKREIGPRHTIGSAVILFFAAGSVWLDTDAIVATI